MTYQSPFTTRYGSEEMRALWSETAKRRAWRRVWVAVAEVQADLGLVPPEQVEQLRARMDDVDLRRAVEIEAEIGHDLMAELRAFAEQCGQAGGVLHWGMTSADVQDNADVVRQRAALALLLGRLRALLLAFADRIEATADLPTLGYTHLQAAEPTTLGYRLSLYAYDLLNQFDHLARLRQNLRGKGLKGAVGTAASFAEMLEGTGESPDSFEARVMERLGLAAHPIAGQSYPRLQDFALLAGLAGLAAALHKFGLDLRLMQSSGIGVAAEPFGERQVGSSAMPFKRNPVRAEKICSLARLVAADLQVAWTNAAATALERTLDDSANRRRVLPEAFLACDEMLIVATEIVQGLVVDEAAARRQLEAFGPFAATERLLTALVRAGADRQAMHERLRQHSLQAWEAVRQGRPNPLPDLVASDTHLLHYLQPRQIRDLLDVADYVGTAPRRARELAARLRARFAPVDDPSAP